MRLLTSFFIGFFLTLLGSSWLGLIGWLIGMLMSLIIVTLESVVDEFRNSDDGSNKK